MVAKNYAKSSANFFFKINPFRIWETIEKQALQKLCLTERLSTGNADGRQKTRIEELLKDK